MPKAAAPRRDWGTLFFDETSAKVRLWYCRNGIYTANELLEANIHPLRAWYLGEFGPREYDPHKVAEAAAALAAEERRRGVDAAELSRVQDNVRWIKATSNTARFKLTAQQRAALLAGRQIEVGDLFGAMRVGGSCPAGS